MSLIFRSISLPVKNRCFNSLLLGRRSLSVLQDSKINSVKWNQLRRVDNNALVPLARSSSDASKSHDHSKVWTAEKLLSAGLLGVIPASFFLPLPGMDYLLAVALMTHIHWGVEAIVVDYVRPALFGNFIPKLAIGGVYLLTILTLGGLFYFNYTDVGMIQAIRMFVKST